MQQIKSQIKRAVKQINALTELCTKLVEGNQALEKKVLELEGKISAKAEKVTKKVKPEE